MIPLTAIIYSEGDIKIAHCLELDLPGEGDSSKKAMGALVELVGEHIDQAKEEHGRAKEEKLKFNLLRPFVEGYKMLDEFYAKNNYQKDPPSQKVEQKGITINFYDLTE